MTKTKFLSIILAVLLVFSIVIINGTRKYNTNTSADVQQTTPARGTVTEPAVHKFDTSLQLHDINVTPGSNVFFENGVPKYSILYDMSNANIRQATAFIQNNIQAYLGFYIPRYDIKETPWTEDGYWIVVDDVDAYTQAGGVVPSVDLSDRGYYIKTIGRSVFIMSKSINGIGNAAVEFLYQSIGWEQFSLDIATVNVSGTDKVYMPNMDIKDKPDFEYAMNGNWQTQTETYGFKQNLTKEIFVKMGGQFWHNTTETLDIATYRSAHPSWYSTDWDNSNANKANQICYTARGNASEYNAMVNEVVRLMKIQFDENPDTNNVTWTMQDVYRECQCQACRNAKSTYGASSGAILKMCNDISAKLDEIYEPQGRRITVMFFAYHWSDDAPTKNITFGKNVGVFIAPLHANYNKSFYDTSNNDPRTRIEKWSKLTDNIFYWLYETNYSHYIFPYDSFDTMIETLRFCRTQGKMLMFIEGQYNTQCVTCFGKLKQYFDAKAMWDVNVSFKDICDKYFPAMFGPAGDIMRQYFEELEIQLKKLHVQYQAELGGGIYENIAQSKYWPKALLDIWNGYIQKAYKAVEPVKAENSNLYDKYCKNIKIESLFIQYAILSFYTGYYNANELKAMRKQFQLDEAELRNTNKAEQTLLDTEFATWEN